ncbi:MAG: BlaI/MecI/CopY family transcriptional regulator [Lachnospiraceae bacterium]|jgi:BlaI family penicillinase repressor|nr:BlaI/MecI/CopY family transcriptional regulator [Lachnospiraceae bacterium]MCI8995088.1 BlaI/MecI/CopY family transcriptional regulator [Lachnospiraceae bacterium]
MNRNIRRLPDAEQEVMQALWACQVPAARTDIEEILFQTHSMAMTTLLTLLTRLSERGFVKIEKEGRRSLYTPCISREEYLASQSKSFFEKLCGGNLSVFASALCDSGLSREEIAQLRTLLERGEL